MKPSNALVLGLLVFAAPSACAAGAPGLPALLGPHEADSMRQAIETDRKDTEDWLKGKPTSYLATIQRKDFADKVSLTVGRGPKCDVRLDDPLVEENHLRVTVLGDSFHVTGLDHGAAFKVKDQEMRSATVGPSAISIGRYALRLSHQRYPAIIVFDPLSPNFKKYHGLKYYPVDFKYRYVVAFQPNPRPDTTIILSTRGNRRRAIRAGWFEFLVDGTPCRLEASRLLEPGVGETDMSLFFRDATTGKETYAVGRYVEPVKLADGRYVLDFNSCYNPACAFSDHYNCPIPPKANMLKVAIKAGEMDSHYH